MVALERGLEAKGKGRTGGGRNEEDMENRPAPPQSHNMRMVSIFALFAFEWARTSRTSLWYKKLSVNSRLDEL